MFVDTTNGSQFTRLLALRIEPAFDFWYNKNFVDLIYLLGMLTALRPYPELSPLFTLYCL